MGYRRSNPDMFNIDETLDILPAATAGIMAVRFGLKLAGPLETVTKKNSGGVDVMVPAVGIKHIIAGVIAANLGEGIVASLFGNDAAKGRYAKIAGLGFVGDIIARQRLIGDSDWAKDNLLLNGVDCTDEFVDMSGLQEQSQLGEYVQDESGNVYMLPDGMSGLVEQSHLGGFTQTSRTQGAGSSFGYG